MAHEESAEASAINCSLDKHLILLPTTGFQSSDLVVHELGHAAEFTMRRHIEDDWALANRPVVSEATAYFAQFRYLRESGTLDRRAGARCAFVPTYFDAQFLFAMSEQERDPRALLEDPRFAVFVDSKYVGTELLKH